LGRGRRSSGAGRLITTVVVAVVLVVAAAFGLIEVDDLQDILLGSGEQGTVQGAGSPSEARDVLRKLEVAPPGSMAGYSRERFPHWSDAEEFGWDVSDTSCDARDAALIRDGRNVRVGEGCDVTSGEWRNPYTGRTYTDPSEIDIDHVVPLANAWRSGASSWSEAKREQYANAPQVLLSAEDNANQEKGDKGPEAWKPPNRAIWCDYATRWVSIKASYGLSVNQQEEAALEQMLGTCKGG
jgi:hypothetical protein